ncbi:MAG: ATP-binding protein [Candidatus Neomarinimicrobiota bacterium]
MFERKAVKTLSARLNEPRHFIQVLSGPRQTGKTTIARQIVQSLTVPYVFASADEPSLKDRIWIEQQWESARLKVQASVQNAGVLVLDEIQKISNWSETVKCLWEQDTTQERNLKVVLLGSSPLLMQQGLTESMTGRFEIIPVVHWSFPEMQSAFDYTLDEYLFFGGYPGAAELRTDFERWSNYIIQSIIEPTISHDILFQKRIDKPILLRRLFELGCHYSAQILSYQKMVGQLTEAGNTTTLANYLNLLETVGMLCGVPKYSAEVFRQRASSPKLLALNNALITAIRGQNLNSIKTDPEIWGRIVESAIGAHLWNSIHGTVIKLYYWLDRNAEVDFVLQKEQSLIAIEVKSGRRRSNLPGIKAFSNKFPVAKKLLVGSDGIPLADFLSMPATNLFD